MLDAAREAFLTGRQRWILQHMQSGGLPPDRAARLIRDLTAGYQSGQTRRAVPARLWSTGDKPAITKSMLQSRDMYLVATGRTRTRSFAEAKALVAQGHRVTVFDYRPDARYHRVVFTDDGYWLHTGGIFGREDRSEPLFRKSTRQDRIDQTLARLDGIRSTNPYLWDGKT
jgi:hypothetical protein